MQVPDRSTQAAELVEALSALLRLADTIGFEEAAIHIDAAIIALGGPPTPPPVKPVRDKT